MVKVYQLEVTSICNLTCSFCARFPKWADREHGFMQLDLIDKIDWSETEYVELQLAGEPTLHPKFYEITKKLKDYGLKIGCSTNSTRPNVDMSLVDIITCTTDRERDLVLDKPNVFHQKLGENFPYEDVSHTKKANNENVKTCRTPFEYVTIHYDGDVVPCCKCFGKQHVFGNLYDQTFEEIVNSTKRKKFLDNMHTGKNYACSYCFFANPHKIHEKLLDWIDADEEGRKKLESEML